MTSATKCVAVSRLPWSRRCMSVTARRTVSPLPSSTADSSCSMDIVMAKSYGQRVDRLLEQLAARLGPQQGAAVALSGGITNRNYRVRFGDGDYVVRVPGADTALL